MWYGTLQTGEYLESRAYNPRSVFETPAFAYTSLPDLPIIVSAAPRGCAPGTPSSAALLYRTDRQPAVHRVPGTPGTGTFKVVPKNIVYYGTIC